MAVLAVRIATDPENWTIDYSIHATFREDVRTSARSEFSGQTRPEGFSADAVTVDLPGVEDVVVWCDGTTTKDTAPATRYQSVFSDWDAEKLFQAVQAAFDDLLGEITEAIQRTGVIVLEIDDAIGLAPVTEKLIVSELPDSVARRLCRQLPQAASLALSTLVQSCQPRAVKNASCR